MTTTAAGWPFGNLERGKYEFILADCPWTFKTYSQKGLKKSAQNHYECMPTPEIKALPVRQLAAPDCMVWTYGTGNMLDQQIEVVRAWGFKFGTVAVWDKRKRSGKRSFGPGYVFRGSCEFIIAASIGSPKHSRSHRNIFDGVAREHSRKPEEGYEYARTYMPHARRAYLFSREHIDGFDCWGNEVGKYDLPLLKAA